MPGGVFLPRRRGRKKTTPARCRRSANARLPRVLERAPLDREYLVYPRRPLPTAHAEHPGRRERAKRGEPARWRRERAKRGEPARWRCEERSDASEPLVQRERRARGRGQDLPAQLLVPRLH